MNTLTLNPRTIFRWHVAIAGTLVAIFLALNAIRVLFRINEVPGAWQFFNLDSTANPADGFSTLALLAAGLASAWAARVETSRRARWFFTALAIALTILAIEEFVEVHRRLGFLHAHPPLGMILDASVIGIALAFAGTFLATFRAIERRTFAHLALAGGVYFTGVFFPDFLRGPLDALLSEAFENPITLSVIPSAIGEGMEMLGVALMLRTLLFHVMRRGGALTLRVAAPS